MPAPNAPPEAAVARFRDDVVALIGQQEAERSKLVVGVSGGSDSLALLLLASAAFSGRIVAATIDHGLRPEAADEAQFVRDLCEALGVEHLIGRAQVEPGGNLQARARIDRYASLLGLTDAVGAQWLATAHHADDQLETLIMRLNRASGVGGLAGIRRRDEILLRPLLGWLREELEDVVRHCGLTPVEDPSNQADRFDRARLRKALAGVDWIDRKRAARSADALADADAALQFTVDHFLTPLVSAGERRAVIARSALLALPRELQRRLLLKALRVVEPEIEVRERALQSAIDGIERCERLTVGSVLVAGPEDFVMMMPAPPRRGTP